MVRACSNHCHRHSHQRKDRRNLTNTNTKKPPFFDNSCNCILNFLSCLAYFPVYYWNWTNSVGLPYSSVSVWRYKVNLFLSASKVSSEIVWKYRKHQRLMYELRMQHAHIHTHYAIPRHLHAYILLSPNAHSSLSPILPATRTVYYTDTDVL